MGSTNLDNRSFALNDELNVMTYDRAVAERLTVAFRDDLGYSLPVTYEQWSRRGIKAGVLEWMVLPLRDHL